MAQRARLSSQEALDIFDAPSPHTIRGEVEEHRAQIADLSSVLVGSQSEGKAPAALSVGALKFLQTLHAEVGELRSQMAGLASREDDVPGRACAMLEGQALSSTRCEDLRQEFESFRREATRELRILRSTASEMVGQVAGFRTELDTQAKRCQKCELQCGAVETTVTELRTAVAEVLQRRNDVMVDFLATLSECVQSISQANVLFSTLDKDVATLKEQSLAPMGTISKILPSRTFRDEARDTRPMRRRSYSGEPRKDARSRTARSWSSGSDRSDHTATEFLSSLRRAEVREVHSSCRARSDPGTDDVPPYYKRIEHAGWRPDHKQVLNSMEQELAALRRSIRRVGPAVEPLDQGDEHDDATRALEWSAMSDSAGEDVGSSRSDQPSSCESSECPCLPDEFRLGAPFLL